MLKEMMPKDDQWFLNIKWEQMCLECQKKTNGVCADRDCAESKYDPWGDVIPNYLIYPDGNDIEKYIEEKEERLYNNDLRIALEMNYISGRGALSEAQIDTTLYHRWRKLINALCKTCRKIYESDDWVNAYELNLLPESTELHELIQELLNIVGKVNGYSLPRDENMGKLIVAYAFDSSTRRWFNPNNNISWQEQFRLYVERYIARLIINQKSKSQEMLVDDERDLRLTKQMGIARRKRIKRQTLGNFTETPFNSIDFTTFVVLCDVFRCNKKHTIEPIRAVVNIVAPDGTIYQEEISAGYCRQCCIYFLLEADYKKLRSKGVILCQLISKESYIADTYIWSDETELRPESLLHRSGYNVNAIDALTPKQRQEILKRVLDNGLYSINGLLSFLDWLIRRSSHTNSRNMSNALQKWKNDRDFVASYKSDDQRKVRMDTIIR